MDGKKVKDDLRMVVFNKDDDYCKERFAAGMIYLIEIAEDIKDKLEKEEKK